MKNLITALVALTIVTAAAAPSFAFDPRDVPSTATEK